MGIPDHLTCLMRNLYASQEATVRTGHGTTDWFQMGKGVHKAVYCHPVYLTYMQSTWETPGWKKHKLESRLLGEISIISLCRWHHSYGRKRRGTKEHLDEGKWKSWLKTQYSKNENWAPSSITSWQIHGETTETVIDFIFLGSKTSAVWDYSYEIKRHLLLGRKLWPT